MKKILNFCLILLIGIYAGEYLAQNPSDNPNHQPRQTVQESNRNSQAQNSSTSNNNSIQSSQTENSASNPNQNSGSNFHTLDPNEGHIWPSNHVDCVIVTKNPKLVTAYTSAIKVWNNTGAFHFNIVNNPNAPVKLDEKNLKSTTKSQNNYTIREAGVTNSQYYLDRPLFHSAHVYLDNNPELTNQNPHQIQLVAEHELGHVIGLGHTPEGANSVMTPTNAKVDVSKSDIETVKELYHKN